MWVSILASNTSVNHIWRLRSFRISCGKSGFFRLTTTIRGRLESKAQGFFLTQEVKPYSLLTMIKKLELGNFSSTALVAKVIETLHSAYANEHNSKPKADLLIGQFWKSEGRRAEYCYLSIHCDPLDSKSVADAEWLKRQFNLLTSKK